MSNIADALGISMFGPISFARDGQTVPLPLTGSALELFAFLLCRNGRPVTRERVADEIWSSSDSEKSRGALNTAIWRVRKFLSQLVGVDLVTTADCLHLEISSAITTDVGFLNQALYEAASEQQLVLQPGCRMKLASAVARCEGEFMSTAQGDWVLTERERQFNTLMHALTILMHDAAERHDYIQGLEYGRKIVAADPFRERVQCELMWLYVMDGQRSHALSHYECFRNLLKKELGISPMPETAAVAAFIARGEEPQGENAELRRCFGAIDQTRRDLMHAIATMPVA